MAMTIVIAAVQRVKTPTAAAQFLIGSIDTTVQRIDNCQERMIRYITSRMEAEHLKVARLADRIPALFSLVRTRQEARIDTLSTRIQSSLILTFEKQRHQLQLLQQRAKALDPTLLLKRGYSITTRQGRIIKNAAEIKPGTEIETRLEHGITISIAK